MKKLRKEKQFKRQKRLRLTISFVVGMVIFMATAQLFVSNRLASLGQEIEKEKQKTEALGLENRILQEQIGQQESLINISAKAQELGFVEAESVYYLVPQIPVAMK